MSSGETAVAAVDLGASSGRVMLGRVGPGRLELTEVSRFRNGAVPLPDGLYWDILGLYQDILAGLRDATGRTPNSPGSASTPGPSTTGSSTATARLLGNPRHYRDPRTDAVIDTVQHGSRRPSCTRRTGCSTCRSTPCTSSPPNRGPRPSRRALLIPDLLGYWLTGEPGRRGTNASTTGLLDAVTGEWDHRR